MFAENGSLASSSLSGRRAYYSCPHGGKGGKTVKKKLEQAVEYANKTNPSSKANNQPSTSKKEKTKF
jgi:hypothetical protein